MKNWDDRRYFLAVARAGSVNKAAGMLSVNRTTVMRRIAALETELGVKLFERQPGGYFLTAAGEDLKLAAEQIEQMVEDADRKLAGRDASLSGTIRIAVSGVLSSHILMPEFAAFQVAHPEIRLEILATYDMPDLARREADVAIRISNDPPDYLVGRRITKVARAAYVAEHILPEAEVRAREGDFGWIGWLLDPDARQWLEDSGHPDLPVTSVITDPLATVEAIRAGMGMSILPCYLGDQVDGLVRMPPGGILQQTDLWVLLHPDLRGTARIQVFTEFIGLALLRHRRLLEGGQARPSPAHKH